MELSLATVVGLLIGSVVFYLRESRTWNAERSQLLDRIMSRDFTGYIAGTRTVKHEPQRQLLSDEEEAAWYSTNRGDITDGRPEARISFNMPLTLPEES